MCGIAAVFNPLHLLSKADRAAGHAMREAMIYRGPDEAGELSFDHVYLGHRRLSIIDLASGQQPMESACGQCILVFNGEIYNHKKLREELAKAGRVFRTHSDTEVILEGYLAWGKAVVDHLNGMFAFAIWDRNLNTLFCARDPLGKKPLYYLQRADQTLFVASDMQGMCAGGQSTGEISEAAMQMYFGLGYIPAPRTIYRDIQKLPAGHTLTCSAEGLAIREYWDVAIPTSEKAKENSFEQIFGSAVSRRLESEVPLGAFLSGGIDSNLVTAAMCRHSKDLVRTYTAGFSQQSSMSGVLDERSAAARAAEHYGCANSEILVNGDSDFLIPSLVPFLGEPISDPSILPTWLICREARKHVTVALTGDGGDEPFGGYTWRYLPHLLENRIRQAVPAFLLRPICRVLNLFWPDTSRLPRWLRLKTLWRNLSFEPYQAYYYDQSPLRGTTSLLADAFARKMKLPEQRIRDLYHRHADSDLITRMLYTDTKLYMCEDVLVKADRMSMAHSLELRSPLLDKEVVNFAFSLPSHEKVSGGRGKVFLRKFAASLAAPHILNRPKTGFSIPAEEYLRTQWRTQFEIYVLSNGSFLGTYVDMGKLKKRWKHFLKGNNRDFSFFWMVLVLAVWHREFHLKQGFLQTPGNETAPAAAPDICLASASPRRKLLLGQLVSGRRFEIRISHSDETPRPGASPEEAALETACLKARAVQSSTTGSVQFIIGADTIVVTEDNTIIGKPAGNNHMEKADDARRIIRQLQSRRHRVITGVCLLDTLHPENSHSFIETTQVVFRSVSEDELEDYIRCGEWEDKAGAYGIQGKAGAFVESIDGSYSNVVGLPQERLRAELTAMGCMVDAQPSTNEGVEKQSHSQQG